MLEITPSQVRKELFTTAEVAQALGVAEITVKKHVGLGTLPSITIGRARRIRRDVLERVIREGISVTTVGR